MLPVELFALLMDAVICGIDRWQTGEHQTIDFDAEAYLPIHENSMAFLEDWLAEYGNEELHPKDLARALLTDMLSKARHITDTPAEKEQSRRSMFPMGVFAK
ncbi:hypothetical protein B0H17DRAFT_1049912 [Mycena rosella]|uniref:DUF6532 domain-containing protein n=1 Tax=Mycena rosella TaxID=1033263 RepID=A0AAD7DSY6_MYCRO|nr:hypothetical protein B0H17DRAFT_1049912 [Mycena rosella]